MASLTTSGDDIDPQPPSALRVAGGAGLFAMPPLLSDVPHRLRRGGIATSTAAHATPRLRLVQRFPSQWKAGAGIHPATIASSMCGLAGFKTSASFPRAALTARAATMAQTLVTRGPDDSGTWANESHGVAFGFRRLSIVDLSPLGHQPMSSGDGRFTVVFNGEIYNFIELRDELTSLGHEFRGHSDTEVLLAGFVEWGVEVTVRRANGMFAMAIWDGEGRELILARDRIGKKPMYYGYTGEALVFGSELKALRAFPGFYPEIDRDSLALFLRYSYIPAPRTIYRGISKLRPGCLLRVRDGQAPLEVAYWSAAEAVRNARINAHELSDREAQDELDALLRDSVRRRMVADVPLGAFLSGGIDSSLTVALMQAQSSRPVKTFSIGFHEQEHNEADHARAVARHLGTSHTELYVTPNDMLDVIPLLPHIFDEPFADPSQVPTYLVSKLARRDVTVALSGDGGDELFAGYNRYFWGQRLWSGMRHIPASVRRAMSRALAAPSPAAWDLVARIAGPLLPARMRERNAGDKLAKLAPVLAAGNPYDLYLELTSHWKDPLALVRGAAEDRVLADFHAAGLTDPMEAMMLADAMTYLPDDILVKVDRASMAVSLEARAPLLDYRIFEFAWSLPLHMKVRDGKGKWILRRILDRYVPSNLIERPKMGFGVPIAEWLRGPLRGWAEDLIAPQRLHREGYFEPSLVTQTWNEHLSGKRNWQYRLWNVLMFQAWLENHAADARASTAAPAEALNA